MDVEIIRRAVPVGLGVVFLIVGNTIGRKYQQGFHSLAAISILSAAL